MSDLDPDFVAASPRGQWAGPLPELWKTLRLEAWQRRGQWTHRILPRGALVALRVITGGPHTMRLELRLARRGTGTTDGWSHECRVFLNAFHASDWFVATAPVTEGLQESRWIERYHGETEPGKSTCDRCGKSVPPSTLWATPRCDSCAVAAGAEEAAGNRLR